MFHLNRYRGYVFPLFIGIGLVIAGITLYVLWSRKYGLDMTEIRNDTNTKAAKGNTDWTISFTLMSVGAVFVIAAIFMGHQSNDHRTNSIELDTF